MAEASSAGLTSWLVAHHDRRAALPATVLATLLMVDAGFDVCTSAPGRAVVLAIVEAALLEIPIAIVAARLAAGIRHAPVDSLPVTTDS